MLKANELRIGNVIRLQHLTQPLIVEMISNDEVATNRSFLFISAYEAIPLTEEILLNCGFGKKNYSMMCHIYSNGKFEIQNNFTIYFQSKWIKLECLHQLQNLYFALTGEELIINL